MRIVKVQLNVAERSFKESAEQGVSRLGDSWVVISGVISPLSKVISIVTLLITTHEPPSS